MLVTLIVSGLLIAADQAVKYLAVRYLAPVGTAAFLPGVVRLRYTENTGAAFNFLQGRPMLLSVVTGAALLGLLLFLLFRRPKNRWEYLSLLMIFSGGAGNFIDRAARGYVVDLFDFEFMNFAVFNFADILITCGAALLLAAVFVQESRAKKKAAAEGPAPEEGALRRQAAPDGPGVEGEALSAGAPCDAAAAGAPRESAGQEGQGPAASPSAGNTDGAC